MNDLFASLGIEGWKPLIGQLLLPPVPFLVLVLLGARLMFRRRLLAWTLVLAGCGGLWLTSTPGFGGVTTQVLTHPPRALTQAQIAELKGRPRTAIVVLGGGRKLYAPEYGVSNLKPITLERLRYALWLSRETGLPVLFSGGVGHGSPPGPSEAEIAARIAAQEFGRPLRWTEGQSRDTVENGLRSIALLQGERIERIVLVTSGFHMRRALAAFERAKERSNASIEIVPAPMALEPPLGVRFADWMPSTEGYAMNVYAWHEFLGRLAGA